VLMLAGIQDPKLASHPSSSSHSLSRRVVCHPEHPVTTIMGDLVLRASVYMLRILVLLVDSLFRFRPYK